MMEKMFEVEPLDSFRAYLAEQTDVQELNVLREKYATMGDYLKRMGKHREGYHELQNGIAERKLRLDRRIGEITSEMEKSSGGRPSKNSVQGEPSFKKSDQIKDSGLKPMTVKRNEQIASLGEDEFEAHIEQTKAKGGELTQAGVLAVVRNEKRRQARADKAEELAGMAPDLPEQKYRLIYCDPPWDYDRKVSIDHYHHYPSMTTEELCGMDIEGVSESDSVLAMWVTSPKLVEGLKVMEAWGYEYKTSLIWDKVLGHYGGFYSRTSHEILLIGTRGRGLETPRVRYMESGLEDDREVSVYREQRTKHSKKPEYYYGLLEKMFGDVTRVELFARNEREGWACWGNETTKEKNNGTAV